VLRATGAKGKEHSMNNSLTNVQILAAFESYNLDIWPMQAVAYLLGIVALFFAVKRTQGSGKITSAIVSFLWLWTGIVFCMFYFGPVFALGYGMGVLMIIQGVLFFADALRPRLSFHLGLNVYSIFGILFIAYAMLGYPLVGHFVGHDYPRALPFGLVPCPTTVFTFGLFMLSDKRVPIYFLIIPILFTIGAVVPVSRGVLEDIGLMVAGVVGTVMILYRDSKRQTITT
jgi:hypothetical protein